MNIRKIIIALILVAFTFSANSQIIGNYGKNAILYNVNIVDVENSKILYNMDITIKEGIFYKINKSNKSKNTPIGAIDLSGKYIMPGLIDSHVHWANFAKTKEELSSIAEIFSDYGITSARDLGGDARVIEYYNKMVADGEIHGPHIYYSSFWAGKEYFKLGREKRDDIEGYGADNAPWNQMITDANRDFEAMIISAKKEGCTGLKLYADINRKDIATIVKLCKKHGIKAWGHFSLGPEYAYEATISGIEVLSHSYMLNFDDEESMHKLIYGSSRPVTADGVTDHDSIRKMIFTTMVDNNQIFDPTLYMCVVNKMENSVKYLTEAHKSGVKVVAGTDYIDIKEINGQKIYKPFLLDELDLYVDSCGFSVPDAIKTATINGAEALGLSGKLGIIKKGAIADYLVLNSNPLESLDAIRSRVEEELAIKAGANYQKYNSLIRAAIDEQSIVANAAYAETEINVKDSLSNLSNKKFMDALNLIVEGAGVLSGTDYCVKLLDEYLFMINTDYNSFKAAIEAMGNDTSVSDKKTRIMNEFAKSKSEQLEGKAPQFSLPDPDGNMVSLSDFAGEYVLVDFWASWCAPCRKKNRELNKYYDELKNAGLNIISISFDEKPEQWKNALSKDGVKWIMLNAHDGLYKSEVADKYKVKQLPTVYLISKKGYILTKNPSIEEIRSYLNL